MTTATVAKKLFRAQFLKGLPVFTSLIRMSKCLTLHLCYRFRPVAVAAVKHRTHAATYHRNVKKLAVLSLCTVVYIQTMRKYS
jgi:hypothetical protein